MADLIRTIESDDEDVFPSPTASTSAAPQQVDLKKRKRSGGEIEQINSNAGKQNKKNGKDKNTKADRKGKGRLAAEDDDISTGFQFDGLGGGEYLSRGSLHGDAWDVNDMSRLFKKRNAPPRITVDDIIARRRMLADDAKDDLDNNGEISDDEDLSEDEDNMEDIESLEDMDGTDDEDEEADDNESGSDNDIESPDLDDEHNDDANVSSNDSKDFQDLQDSDTLSEDDEDLSPFAKLANAAVSVSDDEEAEALNFSKAADATLKDTSYFAKAPDNARSKITSNEALEKSSLPPFSALPGATLSRPILLGLSSMGLTTPTPVQAQTIPVALMGKDIVGSSITGSGKTVAFWVGVLERLLYRDKKDSRTRVLVITPTRELAVQVFNVGVGLARYTDIRFCLCVGGLSLKSQEAELKTRPDVLVVTPGRLIDHIRNTPNFNLMDSIEILIIDEADRVLEEGFKDELLEIVQNLPKKKQSMLFSATVNEDVKTLSRLSLVKPVRINIDASLTTSSRLVQEFVKLRLPTSSSKVHPAAIELVRQATLLRLCQDLLAKETGAAGKTIIFFRSKKTVHRVKILFSLFGLRADELHGDLSQEMRLKALSHFRDGKVDWLLATDLASRGLDIRGISTVINYSMPGSFEIYLHRVGRTARAGKTGKAITIVTEGDRKMVRQAIKASQSAGKGKDKGKAGGGNDVDSEDADTYMMKSMASDEIKATTSKIQDLAGEVEAILLEEKEEKVLRQGEVELEKGENMLKYRDEIMARPKRTWFQSEREKEVSRIQGKKAWNEKMDMAPIDSKSAIEARKDAAKRDAKKQLNHKQKRRQEALDELSLKKGKNGDSESRSARIPKYDSSVRNAKKAQRPGAVAAPGSKSNPKKKHRLRNSGTFGSDRGEKKSTDSKGKSRSTMNQKAKKMGKR